MTVTRQRSATPVMRTPRNVNLDLTARCNLSCAYCYQTASPAGDRDDLPTAEWLRFFAELGRLAVMRVSLSGGEPLLRNDLPTLIDGIVRHRMRWSLVSNGTLFDPELARFMARDRRCDFVQISLDGASAASHDSCRGDGSFDAALSGLRLLVSHHVPVAVRVTIHRHNLDDLEAIAGLLLDDLGLAGFSVNSVCRLGGGGRHASDIGLGVEDRTRAMATFDRLERHYPGRITAQAGPLADLQRWREMEAARVDPVTPPVPGGGRLSACGSVFTTIAVRSDGVVVPCTLLPGLELGRINRDPLDELWCSSRLLQRLRARQGIELASFAFCACCAYTAFCTGNCPALALAEVGELDHPSPDACLRRFLDSGGRLPEATRAAAEPATVS